MRVPSDEDAAGPWRSVLAAAGAGIEAVLTAHDDGRYMAVRHRVELPLDGGVREAEVAGSRWLAECAVVAMAGCSGAFKVRLALRCVEGLLPRGSVALQLVFRRWDAGNYVLLPAAAYNGNRFAARRIPYSPKLAFARDIGADRPMVISDVPRLAAGPGPSRLHERSGGMAMPAAGFHDPAQGAGFLLLAGQGNALGDHGFVVEESRDRRTAWFGLQSPVVREGHSYRICDACWPTEDAACDFHAGDGIVIEAQVHFFAAATVQALFDRLAALRPVAVPHPAKLPYSACFRLQEEKFNRENFVPEHGYYSVGLRENYMQDWQIGWTGGLITTLPLLQLGSEVTRRNALHNFDWLFPAGISPSGLFWDSGRNGVEWIGGDLRNPHTHDWHLIRKSGDGLWYALKQFHLLRALGLPVRPAWEAGVLTVAEALLGVWRRHGQFGQFVHTRTGEVIVGGSTSGAIIPAALLLAGDWFGRGDLREAGLSAAEHFYTRFTRRGITCGGPADALQNPDSESSYALVESYAAAAQAEGSRLWWERAGEAARQFASWVVAYDFAFPERSTFARAGIRTTGAVYANTQNKHAAPGICTYSGLALLKVFRATGDRFALDLLRAIARGLPQYLPHPGNPLGMATHGRMCERVNMTDWEGAERIGETSCMSTWAETSLLLTIAEIPGVYARPDLQLAAAFDHVEAAWVEDPCRGAPALVLRNPTAHDAEVAVWIEDAEGAAGCWPEAALATMPRVSVPAGGRVVCPLGPGLPAMPSEPRTFPLHA